MWNFTSQSAYSQIPDATTPSETAANASDQVWAAALPLSTDDYSLNAIAPHNAYPSHNGLLDLQQSNPSEQGWGNSALLQRPEVSSLNAIVADHSYPSPTAFPGLPQLEDYSLDTLAALHADRGPITPPDLGQLEDYIFSTSLAQHSDSSPTPFPGLPRLEDYGFDTIAGLHADRTPSTSPDHEMPEDYSLSTVLAHYNYPSPSITPDRNQPEEHSLNTIVSHHADLSPTTSPDLAQPEPSGEAASPALPQHDPTDVEASVPEVTSLPQYFESQPPFAHRTVNLQVSGDEFSLRERELLELFANQPGRFISHPEIMQATELKRSALDHLIRQINMKIKSYDCKPILRLVARIRTPYALFLMEPERPLVVKQGQRYELMRHSFSSLDVSGRVHDIPLRDDEFALLELLINRKNEGASYVEIDTIIHRTAPSNIRIDNVLANLNRRLKPSTLSIVKVGPPGTMGQYRLHDSIPAHTPPFHQ